MYTLKKSLGQHLLHDENVCHRIVSTLAERSFTQLLEVGPGAGALTKYLVVLPAVDFKAVEIDQEKINYLLVKYPSLQNRLIAEDFLEMTVPFTGPFTVIGNFPYNISSQIVFKVLQWTGQVECLIGMFQKELAVRISAPPGSKTYGVISVLVQAFYRVEYLFEVSPGSFTPPPAVKSAMIRMLPKKELPVFRGKKELVILVKKAFNQRRKTLRNAVKDLFDAQILQEAIFDRRAEQLSVEDFSALTFIMKPV